jgi:iron(III) transport system substrate-binding protein
MLVVIVLLAAVAAYGWLRPIEPVTEYEELSLEDLAKAEGGTLVLSSILDAPDWEAYMKPRLQAIYPWLEVDYIGGSPSEIFSRVVSEYKAGQVQSDVMLVLGLPNHYLGIAEGALEEWYNPMWDLMAYPEGVRDPREGSQIVYQIPIVLAYNTEMLTEDELPETWQDLTDPKWDGKIVFDTPVILNVVGKFFVSMEPVLGNAAWTDWMQGIADNNPVLTQSASDAYQKVAIGEVPLGICFINDIMAQDPGIPVKAVWLEPTFASGTCASLCTDAPHPYTAKLFLQWLMSADGQESIADTNRIPIHPAIAGATVLAEVGLPPGLEMGVTPGENQDFIDDPEKWADIFRGFFE